MFYEIWRRVLLLEKILYAMPFYSKLDRTYTVKEFPMKLCKSCEKSFKPFSPLSCLVVGIYTYTFNRKWRAIKNVLLLLALFLPLFV